MSSHAVDLCEQIVRSAVHHNNCSENYTVYTSLRLFYEMKKWLFGAPEAWGPWPAEPVG